MCGGLVDFRTIAAPLPCCCETYVQCSQGLFLARTVQKPECCVNLILQQMEEEQYPGQYWQGRQQREQNGAGWLGVSQRLMRADPVMDVSERRRRPRSLRTIISASTMCQWWAGETVDHEMQSYILLVFRSKVYFLFFNSSTHGDKNHKWKWKNNYHTHQTLNGADCHILYQAAETMHKKKQENSTTGFFSS